MLSAYVNAPDMEGAENFFKRLEQDGFRPNVVTFGTMIKGYAKINDLEKMMKRYEEMCSRNIKPNQTIYTTIMDAHGKNKDFDSAVVWYKELEVCGFSPDQKAKNILLSLAKTEEEQAEANAIVGNLDYPNNVRTRPQSSKFVSNDDSDSESESESDEEDDDEENSGTVLHNKDEVMDFGILQQNLEELHIVQL